MSGAAWRERERDWLARLPKVELHVHLEGAIPHAAFWTLLEKYGGDPAAPTPAALAERFAYHDFSHFLEIWGWKNGYLREYEDFTLVAREVARDLAAQNVRYAEVFFSPADFARHGLEPQPLAAAVRRGLDEVAGVRVALVADLVRDFGPERGARVLEEVREAREHGVIGIGIGGSEREFPPEAFASVYRRARDLDFRTSAHAGEGAGPDSVWGALRALAPDRLGHGTRAVEDEALVAHLAELRIPLELCPLSNVRTGVVARLEEHPIRTFLARGIPVSVNTDDPRMFDTTLVEEFLQLRERLAFTRDEIRGLIAQAVESSWLPEAERRGLLEEFRREPAWSEPEG